MAGSSGSTCPRPSGPAGIGLHLTDWFLDRRRLVGLGAADGELYGFYLARGKDAYAFKLFGEDEPIWIPRSQMWGLEEAPRYEWKALGTPGSLMKEAMSYLEGRQQIALMDLARELGIPADRGLAGQILARMGWRVFRVRRGGVDCRVWRPVPVECRAWEAPKLKLSGRGNKERHAFIGNLWKTGLGSNTPLRTGTKTPDSRKNRSPLFPPCGFGRPRGCRCAKCSWDRESHAAQVREKMVVM